jgi:hypothetical protein
MIFLDDTNKINNGLVNEIHLVDGRIYKVAINPKLVSRRRLVTELSALSLLRKNNLPAARPYKIETCIHKGVKKPCLILEYIDSNRTLSDTANPGSFFLERVLPQVHGISNDRYGELNGLKFKSWRGYLLYALLSSLLYPALYAQKIKLVASLMHFFIHLLKYIPNQPRISFLLIDYNLNNFLIKNNDEIVMIDVDHPIYGCIEYDVASLLWYKNYKVLSSIDYLKYNQLELKSYMLHKGLCNLMWLCNHGFPIDQITLAYDALVQIKEDIIGMLSKRQKE